MIQGTVAFANHAIVPTNRDRNIYVVTDDGISRHGCRVSAGRQGFTNDHHRSHWSITRERETIIEGVIYHTATLINDNKTMYKPKFTYNK